MKKQEIQKRCWTLSMIRLETNDDNTFPSAYAPSSPVVPALLGAAGCMVARLKSEGLPHCWPPCDFVS